ncbi:MAG: gamma-glutamyl-gamma-aminobutyrate hydrolase family protein, partial [Acidobacteriota bacterium]
PEYPVLGICLGSQTMNVAAGGSLVQDIPSEIYGLRSVEQVLKQERDKVHSSRYVKLMYPGSKNEVSPAFHRIKVLDRSVILKSMVGKEGGFPMVLSSHHQSVKKLGKDLFVTATSMDGKIVEAIEHKKYKNVLGVQFHPEYRNLHKGLNFVTNHPKSGKFFSLKNFLKKNPPSTEFHKNLWSWFSVKIKR